MTPLDQYLMEGFAIAVGFALGNVGWKLTSWILAAAVGAAAGLWRRAFPRNFTNGRGERVHPSNAPARKELGK